MSGHYKGKTIQIPNRDIVIGRERDCFIRLFSSEISRHHCRLEMTSNGLELEDLKSSNGTILNGAPLTEKMLLKSGDTFRVGPAEFQVCKIKSGRPGDPDSVDESEIAQWLSDQEKSPGDLGTTVIETIRAATAREPAAVSDKGSSSVIPKPNLRLDKVFQSLHEEAQDIIRRHHDFLAERAAEGDTKILKS